MAIATEAYVPGVCNINREEIKRRRNAGYFGLILTAALLAVLFGFSLDRWLRIIVFVPAFIAAIGFLQARNHFCVAYASSGVQNAADGGKIAQTIVDDAHKQVDKRRARQIHMQAGVTAVVVTAVSLII